MHIVLFGATGMIGQGVLRECLLDPDVGRVTAIGRSATGVDHPKLRDLVHGDLWNFGPIEDQLSGIDACFFCLGVTSAGMKESEYERITYGIAAAAGESLARLNPRMTFVLVSGVGADSSEKGLVMWARVKGKAENAILRLPFQGYIFRPGVVQPLDGIRSRTAAYRVAYFVMAPVIPILRWAFPGRILTTRQVGRAMLKIARHGAPKRILESRDLAML